MKQQENQMTAALILAKAKWESHTSLLPHRWTVVGLSMNKAEH